MPFDPDAFLAETSPAAAPTIDPGVAPKVAPTTTPSTFDPDAFLSQPAPVVAPVQAQVDPQEALAAEYSAPERFAIGAGRSVAATGQGAYQLLLKGGEAVGIVEPETVEAYRQEIAGEKALYERGVGGTTAGQVGEVVGAIGAAAPALLIPGGLVATTASLGTRAATAAGIGALEAGLQPVYSEEGFAGEKAKQVALGATIGAGATYGLDKLAGIMPKNLMTRFYKKAAEGKADVVSEADVLEELTGISMTLAEKSQSKSLQMLENVARQSLFSADEIAVYDKKVARQGMASVNRLLRQISKPRKSAETVGIELQRAARDAASGAIKMRKTQADNDYGLARELSGNAKIVERTNYVNALRDVIEDYKGSDMQDAVSIVKQTQQKLNKALSVTPARPSRPSKPSPIVDEFGQPLETTPAIPAIPATEGIVKQTVREAVNDRSFLGNAAKGTGNIFKDVDKNLNRTIASRLHQAMTKDLIDGEALGDVGIALKTANTNYARNSASIKAIEMSPLGRILGKEFDDAADVISAGTFNSIPGEKVAKKIMTLTESEIRQTMRALDKVNPNTADTLRAFVIRDALDNSLLPPSAGMAKGSMSFNKFQTNLDKNKLKAYGLSTADATQVDNIVSAMERIGDRSGYNFSNTEVVANIMNIGRVVVSGSMKERAALIFEKIGLRRIASAMTTPEGRAALQTITKPYQGKTKLDKALRTIERIGIASGAEAAGETLGEQ